MTGDYTLVFALLAIAGIAILILVIFLWLPQYLGVGETVCMEGKTPEGKTTEICKYYPFKERTP